VNILAATFPLTFFFLLATCAHGTVSMPVQHIYSSASALNDVKYAAKEKC